MNKGGGGKTGGREPGRNGNGKSKGGGRRGGGRRYIQGDGSREKWQTFRNIGTIFRNRKSTLRWEPLGKGAGTESAACGTREVQTPLYPQNKSTK